MNSERRPGYYLDKTGQWQRDRRIGSDRRQASQPPKGENRRRNAGRRKSDRVFEEREHREMIEDALVEFAKEHTE